MSRPRSTFSFTFTVLFVLLVSSAAGAAIKLGVYYCPTVPVESSCFPTSGEALDSYKSQYGRFPNLALTFHDLDKPLLYASEQSALKERKVTPIVTVEPYVEDKSASLQDISSGKYDSYIHSEASAAVSFGNEILVRFAHEMNGTWYPWSGEPSAYIAAWRHYVDIFRADGATNVKFVWTPNVSSGGKYPFDAYYPEDVSHPNYVDYVALDGYNWGGPKETEWESLKEIFASSYSDISSLSGNKPVIIAETASVEKTGMRPDWIRTGFLSTIPQEFPNVAAAVWFDRNLESAGHRDWTLESSAGSIEAWQEVVNSPLYVPGKPAVTTEAPYFTNTLEPQLNATVNPKRADTHYWFEYGLTTSYGSKVPIPSADIGSGNTDIAVSQVLKGLKPNTPYYYGIAAENEVGTSVGSPQTFTTLPSCKGLETKCLWSTQTPADPPPATKDEMKGVSCASSTMCIAVGKNLYQNNSFVELWNGTSWSLLQSISGEIRQVACASVTACVAVGASASGAIQTWMIYTLGGWMVTGVAPVTPAGSTESNLQGVSCTSTACTAVGSYRSGSSYKPLAERWNGSAWSLQTAPSPTEGTAQKAMLGVSCASATYCVAVGEAASKPVAQQWNGTEWSLLSVPNPSGAKGAKLMSVSCTSSTSCMAAGDYYETTSNEKTLAERWNGTSWSINSSPNPSEAKGFVNFTAVSCTSSTSCTAAGYYASGVSGGIPTENKTLVESWNGTEWAIQASPNPSGQAYSALLSVSCTSSTACTAVGGSQPSLYSAPATLVERWNGSSWSIQSAINPSTVVEDELKSVACGSTTLCIAVGRDLYTKGSLIDLWDGTKWKYLQGTPEEIKDVSCASAVACVAVGVSGSGSPQSWMIYELSGFWFVSEVAPPTPSGGSQAVLQGVSCTATACTAVGSYNSESGYKPLVERWNGSTWSLQTASNPAEGSAVNAMLSVSCNSSTSCMAVGEAASKPVAERWNGSEWSLTSPPNPSGAKGAKLAGVSCGSPSSCMAVGDYYETTNNEKTLAERWNGSSWSIVTSPNPNEAKGFVNFTDVSCLSPNSCFAAGYYSSKVGENGSLENKTLVETWNGTDWAIQSSTNASGKPYSVLFGISCTSSISCTAVGAASTGLFAAPALLVERYE